MTFNEHSEIIGKHAFLGASKYHWIRYTTEKLRTSFINFYAAQEGTKMHEFAAERIRKGRKLRRAKKTLNQYVNDSIDAGMIVEQPLKYSDNCFGTADAIYFDDVDLVLKIYDLKTGVIKAHMEQLEVYAAIFCLEYGYEPKDLDIELRIYQNSEIVSYLPEAEEIDEIMSRIVEFDPVIDELKEEMVV